MLERSPGPCSSLVVLGQVSASFLRGESCWFRLPQPPGALMCGSYCTAKLFFVCLPHVATSHFFVQGVWGGNPVTKGFVSHASFAGRGRTGKLLPMKTPPGRGVNVPAVAHLDGVVHSWWPHSELFLFNRLCGSRSIPLQVGYRRQDQAKGRIAQESLCECACGSVSE